jgi:hypothetical protein
MFAVRPREYNPVVRRFFRHLVPLVSAVSFVLCLALGVLCALSRYELVTARYNYVPAPDRARTFWCQLYSCGNTLGLWVGTQRFEPRYFGNQPADVQTRFIGYYPPGIDVDYSGPRETLFNSPPDIGFHARHYSWSSAVGHQSNRILLAAPYWFLIGLTAIMPIWWIAAFVRGPRKVDSGLCTGCGYDLRASPDRCPECGTFTDKSAAT